MYMAANCAAGGRATLVREPLPEDNHTRRRAGRATAWIRRLPSRRAIRLRSRIRGDAGSRARAAAKWALGLGRFRPEKPGRGRRIGVFGRDCWLCRSGACRGRCGGRAEVGDALVDLADSWSGRRCATLRPGGGLGFGRAQRSTCRLAAAQLGVGGDGQLTLGAGGGALAPIGHRLGEQAALPGRVQGLVSGAQCAARRQRGRGCRAERRKGPRRWRAGQPGGRPRRRRGRGAARSRRIAGARRSDQVRLRRRSSLPSGSRARPARRRRRGRRTSCQLPACPGGRWRPTRCSVGSVALRSSPPRRRRSIVCRARPSATAGTAPSAAVARPGGGRVRAAPDPGSLQGVVERRSSWWPARRSGSAKGGDLRGPRPWRTGTGEPRRCEAAAR